MQIVEVNAGHLPACPAAFHLWGPLCLLSKSLLQISTIHFTKGTKGRLTLPCSVCVLGPALSGNHCLEIIRSETSSSLFLSLPRQLLEAKLTPVCYFQLSSPSMPEQQVQQQLLFPAAGALHSCLRALLVPAQLVARYQCAAKACHHGSGSEQTRYAERKLSLATVTSENFGLCVLYISVLPSTRFHAVP